MKKYSLGKIKIDDGIFDQVLLRFTDKGVELYSLDLIFNNLKTLDEIKEAAKAGGCISYDKIIEILYNEKINLGKMEVEYEEI